MNFIDSHTHLYREYYPENFEEVIQRAIDANVKQMLLACVNRETPDQIQEVVKLFPENLFAMVGLHPSDVREDYLDVLSYLQTRLDDPNVVAVGEIGLDFYYDRIFEAQQKDAFCQQLRWARDLQLPLSLHIRSAYNEAIEILQQFKPGELSGIVHCFSGGIQEAKWAVARGFAIGIGGIVTFKNSKLPELVKEIGLEHIVLETDAPYLAPTPHRGKPNESAYIPLIAQKIAEIFDVSVREVMEQTSHNVYRIFKKLPANL
jgi:TatD DNase family protein